MVTKSDILITTWALSSLIGVPAYQYFIREYNPGQTTQTYRSQADATRLSNLRQQLVDQIVAGNPDPRTTIDPSDPYEVDRSYFRNHLESAADILREHRTTPDDEFEYTLLRPTSSRNINSSSVQQVISADEGSIEIELSRDCRLLSLTLRTPPLADWEQNRLIIYGIGTGDINVIYSHSHSGVTFQFPKSQRKLLEEAERQLETIINHFLEESGSPSNCRNHIRDGSY